MFPSLLAMVAFEVLKESLSIPHWWLTTIRRNFYQPFFVWIYRDSAIVDHFICVEHESS